MRRRHSRASSRGRFEKLESRLLLTLADAFEVDNDPDQAAPISITASPQTHSIHDPLDVDWVKFSLSETSRVVVETSGPSGDTKLWLFHADRTHWSDAIEYDYDGGEGDFSKIEAYLEPGDYFAAVMEEGQNATIETYQLSVAATSLESRKDSHEADNSADTAATLSPGIPQTRSIHAPYDVDWVMFQLNEPSRATLRVTGLSGRVMLRLYGPDNPSRLISYDRYGDGEALAGIVAYLQPGTYYASVEENLRRDPIDQYSIQLDAVPLADLADSREPDNSASSATAIPVDGTPQAHNIHQPADVDWVTFELTEAARLTLQTDGLDGATRLALYGPDDPAHWIATDQSSGNGSFSKIVSFLGPGRYWAEISENGWNATIDSYIVSAMAVPLSQLADAYEDDGTWDRATPLPAAGPSQEHSIHHPADVDWYQFSLAEASRVVLETDGPEGNTWLGLYSSADTNSPIASDSFSGNGDFSRIVEYLEAGTYFVRVQENWQDAIIDRYTIALETVPISGLVDAYEPDDAPGEARPLPTGGLPEHHNLHRYRDRDTYWFELQEAARVTIETDGPDGRVALKLYRSDNLASPILYEYSDSGAPSASLVAYLDPARYFVTVEPYYARETVDRYTILGEILPLAALEDPYEADNLPADARLIAPNAPPEEHSIHRPTDVDWYRFQVDAASRVLLETDGPEGDTRMTLYASDNLATPLAWDTFSGNGGFSRILFYRLMPGEYYVSVEENGQNATIAHYTMSAEATPLTSLHDSWEADDEPSLSSPLMPTDGAPQPRSIHVPADVDWGRFTLAEASRVVISTDGPAGDTEMWLYGPGDWSSQIAYDANSGKGNFSRIVEDLPAGTYYVKVGERYQDQAIYTYSLSVFAVPQAGPRDPHEVDDAPAQAVPVPADGTRRAHNFHHAADVDWVMFDVAVRSEVVIDTDGAAGSTDLRLFAEGDYDWSTPLARDVGGFSRVFTHLEPGRYFAAVTENGQNATIDHFTLGVEATPLADLEDAWETSGDDTADAATPLALPDTSAGHSIHDADDVDWFRFQLTAASVVTLATSGPPDVDNGTIRLDLFGPADSTLPIGYDVGSEADAELQRVLGPGSYFVRVKEYGNSRGLLATIAEYDLHISASPLGDLKPATGSLSTNLPVGLGETISVEWTAQNQGPGATDPYRRGYQSWTDQIYLSLDQEIDRDDYFLGARAYGGDVLAAGEQYFGHRSITTPDDPYWAGRSAYVLVSIDHNDSLAEAHETNNVLVIPIQTGRHIALEAPLDGRFVDVQTPVDFAWLASDAQPGAVVSLAIDTDADPHNGGYQWILQDRPVTNQHTLEHASLVLPGVPPRLEPYYVWGEVRDGLGSQYSAAIPIVVAERAFRSEGDASEPVGGDGYRVFGIEAAELADRYYVRVRTNYPPNRGAGGDLHIVAGDTTYGLSVATHTIADGSQVHAGELYTGAAFLMGTHVHSVPTFIDSYATRITGKSSVEVLEVQDQPWRYEILATIDAGALGAGDFQGFTAGWSMYCGNDTDRVFLPPPEAAPDLAGTQFRVQPPVGDSFHWGDTFTIDFTTANLGDEPAGASHTTFVLSADATIDPSDYFLTAVHIPSLAPGAAHSGQVRPRLPAALPAGFLVEGTVYVGMIADSLGAVDEGAAGELNNRNRGEGLDRAAISVRLVSIEVQPAGGLGQYSGEAEGIVFRRGGKPVTFEVATGLAGEAEVGVELDILRAGSVVATVAAEGTAIRSAEGGGSMRIHVANWEFESSEAAQVDQLPVGKYEVRARMVYPDGSKSENSEPGEFYVVFETPDLGPAERRAYLFDEGGVRDEIGVWFSPSEPYRLSEGEKIRAGQSRGLRYKLQPFDEAVFLGVPRISGAIDVIDGMTSATEAFSVLAAHVSQSFEAVVDKDHGRNPSTGEYEVLWLLEQTAAQCADMAALLTSYLRSAGIAARPVAVDANARALAAAGNSLVWNFHTWTEGYVDGGWHAVDPHDHVLGFGPVLPAVLGTSDAIYGKHGNDMVLVAGPNFNNAELDHGYHSGDPDIQWDFHPGDEASWMDGTSVPSSPYHYQAPWVEDVSEVYWGVPAWAERAAFSAPFSTGNVQSLSSDTHDYGVAVQLAAGELMVGQTLGISIALRNDSPSDKELGVSYEVVQVVAPHAKAATENVLFSGSAVATVGGQSESIVNDTFALPRDLDTSLPYYVRAALDGVEDYAPLHVLPALSTFLTVPDSMREGEQYVFSAEITNQSNETITAIDVGLLIDEAAFALAGGSRWSEIAEIAPQQSVTMEWTVSAIGPAIGGMQVHVDSGNGGKSVSHAFANVLTSPRLAVDAPAITLRLDSSGTATAPVPIGLRNLGGLEAGDVELEIFLPAGVTAAQTHWQLGDLAGGQEQIVPAELVFSGPARFPIRVEARGAGGLVDSDWLWVHVEPDTPDALGAVDFLRLPAQNPSAGDLWYELQTRHDALLTLESTAAETEVALFSESFRRLTVSEADGSRQRLDWAAAAGQTYFVRLSGTSQAADLRIANLVRHEGDRVTIQGTAEADQFHFEAAAGYRVTINGVAYQFAEAEAGSYFFDGLGGGDDVQVVGGAGADTATLRPSTAFFRGNGYTLAAVNVESAGFDGGAGEDLAKLYGSRNADAFTLNGDGSAGLRYRAAFLDGAVMTATAERVYADGRGGKDSAELHSPANAARFEPFWRWARMTDEAHAYRMRGFHSAVVHEGGESAGLLALEQYAADSPVGAGTDQAALVDAAVGQAADERFDSAALDDLAQLLWFSEYEQQRRARTSSEETDETSQSFAEWAV